MPNISANNITNEIVNDIANILANNIPNEIANDTGHILANNTTNEIAGLSKSVNSEKHLSSIARDFKHYAYNHWVQ